MSSAIVYMEHALKNTVRLAFYGNNMRANYASETRNLLHVDVGQCV